MLTMVPARGSGSYSYNYYYYGSTYGDKPTQAPSIDTPTNTDVAGTPSETDTNYSAAPAPARLVATTRPGLAAPLVL